MIDAARSLLANGAPPDATLAGVYEGALISPVTLSALVRPYRAPRTDHRRADPSLNLDA